MTRGHEDIVRRAAMLFDQVIAEEPPRGKNGYDGRVAVILNGLGTVKYEELFVVYTRIAERLAQHGLTAVR
ncbi:MAG TPA: pantetheine-phosphate adenylyltransferase, partial [Pseudothauera hydrothermalis]|nr:pantetheine-phosphate adenylyltransferase [Pseudothauera hydrothermalis]